METMTRDEALKQLKLELSRWESDCKSYHKTKDALKYAIKELEQEEYYKDLAQSYEKTIVKLTEAIAERQPSEDCVSRQAVLKGYIEVERADGVEIYSEKAVPITYINNLPPVTPTRKKGRWIKVTETEFGNGYQCSECGRFILTESIDGKKLKDFPYCHCGAEMESEE